MGLIVAVPLWQSTGGGGAAASKLVACGTTDESLIGDHEFSDAYCSSPDIEESDVFELANDEYEAELTEQRTCMKCDATTRCEKIPYYLGFLESMCTITIDDDAPDCPPEKPYGVTVDCEGYVYFTVRCDPCN